MYNVNREPEYKTIRQLWNENPSRKALVVWKKTWTKDFCFLVRELSGYWARGTTYLISDTGDITVYKPSKSYSCEEPSFLLFSNNDSPIQEYIWENEKNKSYSSGQVPATFNNKTREKNSKYVSDAIPRVKVDSTVTVIDEGTGESFTFLIVPTTDEIHYWTMGYHTINYAVVRRTSSADGQESISSQSPLGKAIIGRTAGETVTFEAGGAKHSYRIASVSNPD